MGDCNKYDDQGEIAMRLNTEHSTEGYKSLQLEARKHTACNSLKLQVDGGNDYFFKFDYQGDNALFAGYYLGFNDKDKTKISEKISLRQNGWNSFERLISVPKDASFVNLYIYSYESDKKNNNVVRYDNFKFIKMPNIKGKYFLISDSEKKNNAPQFTEFRIINPTKKKVQIKGASTSFFLAMSEAYHSDWKLMFENEKTEGGIRKWWPWAKPDMISDENHFKLDNFLNGWYVDIDALCAPQPTPASGRSSQEGIKCAKNPDGTYDLDLIIEFWPQRWFYLGLIISGTTLAAALGYLIIPPIARRSRKKKVGGKNAVNLLL